MEQVQPGQVWIACDPRWPDGSERRITVESVDHRWAHGWSQWFNPAGQPAAPRRKTRIQLEAFRRHRLAESEG